jgi:undecaprenyl-diphosphatase
MKIINGLFFVMIFHGAVLAQNPDVSIFRSINNWHSPASDRFFSFQSNTVKPLSIGLPLGMIVFGAAAKDRNAENNGTLMALAHLMNFGLTYGTKIIVNRKRPYETMNNVHLPAGREGTRSFPSGHTSSAFTTAAMLSLSYPKWYVIAPAYAWAGLAAYSRMALGVHYPSDVLVGALVGTGVALLIHHYRKPIIRQKDRIFRYSHSHKPRKKNERHGFISTLVRTAQRRIASSRSYHTADLETVR